MPSGKLTTSRIPVKIRHSFAQFQVFPLTEAAWSLKQAQVHVFLDSSKNYMQSGD